MNPYCLQAAKTKLLTTTCLILQPRFGCQTTKTTHLNADSPFRASYNNTRPPVPGGKALLPPMIKTEGKPTSNSEGLTHSKGSVMQHKHPMVVVQQRSLGPGCPSSLYPNTVRPPEPLPAALLPARSLRTDTTRSPPHGSAPPQGQRARAETTDPRGGGRHCRRTHSC